MKPNKDAIGVWMPVDEAEPFVHRSYSVLRAGSWRRNVNAIPRRQLLQALLVTLVAGCATSQVNSGLLTFDGHVVYQDIEGGFWAINSNDGRHFVPLTMPETYHKAQLRVRVKAIPRPDIMSTQMYGPIIEIREISVLP